MTWALDPDLYEFVWAVRCSAKGESLKGVSFGRSGLSENVAVCVQG